MSLPNQAARLGGFAAGAFAVVALVQSPAQAGSFKVVYAFSGGDGQGPQSGLMADSSGRLVGTTPLGGVADKGLVYRLTPPLEGGASWTEEVLYDFAAAGDKTSDPVASVTPQGDGTIFGTASLGGKGGGGIVYRLDDSASEAWTLTVLHSFANGADGSDPCCGVSVGPSGLLYGSTIHDGSYGEGTIYTVSPTGVQSAYRLMAQPKGTYGASRAISIGTNRLAYTLTLGGANGQGAVMGAKETAPGHYHTSLLYSFAASNDAAQPSADSQLLHGPNQILYGCAAGGAFGIGAVYQLTPPATAGAAWTENVLYNFGAQPADPDGSFGECYITAGSGGRIVGVSTGGGANGQGALFALDPPIQAGSPWTETVLNSFSSRRSGLWLPKGVPVRIGNTYYGTATFGGIPSTLGGTGGGVWSFTP